MAEGTRGRFAAILAGARAPLGCASLRGRFAAILAGARAPLGYASLRGRFAALLAAALAVGCAAWPPWERPLPPAPPIDAGKIAADVRWLADDAREGRGAGTQGLDEAAEWLAQQFRAAGLTPLGDAGGFLQRFEMPVAIRVTRESLRAGKERFAPQRDFAALLSSADASLRGELVFAGYGISAPEEGYDDWAGLDAAGGVALVLEDRPGGGHERLAGVHGNAYLSRASKIANARDHGAAAVLFAPASDEAGGGAILEVAEPDGDPGQGASGIPVLALSRRAAARLVALAGGPSLAERQRGIDAEFRPASQRLAGVPVQVEVRVERRTGSAANVLGLLEGSDPVLRREVVVI